MVPNPLTMIGVAINARMIGENQEVRLKNVLSARADFLSLFVTFWIIAEV